LNHFNDEAWVDFVRQTAPPPRREDIQRHLDEGCVPCARAHGVWTAVASLMSRESQYEVPEQAMIASDALFEDWRRRFVIPKRARVARLVFDSLLGPVAVGVRGGTSPARRLLHRTGPWSVDIRMELLSGTLLLLDGQLLKSEPRSPDSGEIKTFLADSNKVLASASLNQFGEFQLQCQLERDMRAYFDIPGETPIAVTLPKLP
jgi:hypothetical protein